MDTIPPSLVCLLSAVAACGLAATFSARLTPVLERFGAVAPPGPGGSGRPLPRGGGLAIVAVVVPAAVLVAWLAPASRLAVVGWLVPAVGVAAVSLRDDFKPLPALLRLAVHVVAAIAVVTCVGPVEAVSLGGLSSPPLGPAAWPLTVLWIVGLTNAFNFMDGIDGIAGITTAAAAAAISVAAGVACEPVGLVALVLAAGALGFLTTNWPPARVFMGDVGSTFCGFTIAALPLLPPPAGRRGLLAVAVLATWPFVADAGLTLLKRLARRENVLEPHRGHLYQRLVIAGWPARAVSGLYGFLAAAGGIVTATPLLMPPLQATADGLAAVLLVFVPVSLVVAVHVAEARVACNAT